MFTTTNQEHQIRRVAIIGAGIAGLATAACLKHLNTGVEEVFLFDNYEYRGGMVQYTVGGALAISGGAVILDAIGCLDELKKYGHQVKNLLFTHNDEKLIDLDLNSLKGELPSILYQNKGEGDAKVFTLRWNALRKILHDHAFRKEEIAMESKEASGSDRGCNPINTIYCKKKRFEYLEEDRANGTVTVHFSDSSFEEGFDLVIGADGLKSKVRQYTQYPDQTIARILPFTSYFSWSRPNQNTGIRVVQCTTPVGVDRAGQDSSSDLVTPIIDRLDSLKHKCHGEVHQWSGNYCNALTMALGNRDTQHYLLAAIYRENGAFQIFGNKNWDPWLNHKQNVSNLLNLAGFKSSHSLHAILDAADTPGGIIVDIGIRDSAIPLRKWSSKSGMVILVGDSAHTMSPFLGQGANQAIQDAFCLSSLIYKYNNNGKTLKVADDIRSAKSHLWSGNIFFVTLNFLYGILNVLFDLLQSKPYHATRMQTMAYEYEKTRKFHTTIVTISSRFLGHIETRGGRIGWPIKNMFFRFLNWSGLAKLLLINPMKPVI